MPRKPKKGPGDSIQTKAEQARDQEGALWAGALSICPHIITEKKNQ